MAESFDVIVVGAGIFGSSVAYHLKKLGVPRVLVLEKGSSPAAGTTSASAAIVRQHYSNQVLSELTGESIEIFRELEAARGRADLFTRSGWYFLVPPELHDASVQNVDMQKRAGVVTGFVSLSDPGNRLPWLNTDGIAAIVHEPNSGYADPVKCTEAFIEAFERLGGEVRFSTPCESLVRQASRVVGVTTGAETFHARCTVNACGPWAAGLAKTAKIDLPISIYREQETIWEFPHADEMPACSISNGVDAIYLRPMGQRRYTIGRGFPKEYTEADPNRYARRVDDSFVNDVLTRVQRRFPPFARATYIDGFASLYDVTPDWYPFVGLRRDVSGYADASGGSGHGFKLAPALGAHLARWISGAQVAPEVARLSYDRVTDGQMFVQKYGGNRG